MKNTIFTISAVLLFSMSLYAQELIQMGEMNNIKEKDFRRECHLNGGKISFVTEEKNKCGKLELTRISKEKYDVAHASLFIGGTKTFGFPCKPDTIYEYSIDIKGNAPVMTIKGAGWEPGKNFYQCKSLNPQKVIPTAEWVNVKGEFKTGPKTEKAALFLQFWASTQWGPMPYKVGDYVLFDNVSVKEKKMINSMQGAENR